MSDEQHIKLRPNKDHPAYKKGWSDAHKRLLKLAKLFPDEDGNQWYVLKPEQIDELFKP